MNLSRALGIAALAVSFTMSPALARGHSGSHSGTSHSSGSHSSYTSRTYSSHAKPSSPHSHHSSNYAQGVKRDSHGKIARSHNAKNDFKRQQPCPSTGKSSGACPGYVIDHVKPLKRGGADKPGNMQWQTKEAAKQKDKWE